jgi:hypothetical protein
LGKWPRILTARASLPGATIKHFNAYDPFAKWTVARPCKQATAKYAASFLDQVLQQMPDPVKAIQIDAGFEFVAEFEQACADRKLSLYVPPPRSPKLNGAVERCNCAGDASSTPASICQCASIRSPSGRCLPAPLQPP